MYDEIKIFEGNRIRSIWNEEKEEWYFSIIDILGILTESENPRKYWSVFKVRLAYMKGNMQSRNFWRKCGFTETGVEKENEHGMAVIMECNCLQFPELP